MANRCGTRWRGKLAIPDGAHPFVKKFFAEANRQHTTLAEVADRAGIDRHTLTNWRRIQPKLGDLEAALNVLDLELVIRVRHA